MTTFYIEIETPGPLQELAVGKWVTVNGERRHILSMSTYEAIEEDQDLGVEVGDMVTTVSFSVEEATRP